MTTPTWEDLYGPEAEAKRNGVSATPSPLSAGEMARLEDMDREELIALVRRIACQYGQVAMMTEEEKFQAGMDRLAKLYLTLPDSQAKEISTVFDRWADRSRGKPAMTVNTHHTLTLEQLVLQSYVDPNKLHLTSSS